MSLDLGIVVLLGGLIFAVRAALSLYVESRWFSDLLVLVLFNTLITSRHHIKLIRGRIQVNMLPDLDTTVSKVLHSLIVLNGDAHWL